MQTDSTVVIRFSGTRSTEGDDIAALLRDGLGDAVDVTAEFDERGALSGYVLTTHWPTADRVADAAFRLCELLRELGYEPEVS
jgi:hypothetical protein